MVMDRMTVPSSFSQSNEGGEEDFKFAKQQKLTALIRAFIETCLSAVAFRSSLRDFGRIEYVD